jgi:hypothetical protein
MTAGLLAASALGLMVTAAQTLPVAEFTRLSLRAAEGEGYHDVYPFGLHPIRAAEAVWPNLFGTIDTGNRSWLEALPPANDFRVWFPSVYLGGLTVVLAATAAGFRGGPPWRAWLSVVAVVPFLASLGAFGSPLFWARCVPGWGGVLGPLEPPEVARVRDDGFLRDGDGGVYWLLASALPVFREFRYPAKLLVFSVLGVSGLAGLGWDRVAAGRSRRALLTSVGLLVLGAVGLSGTWVGAGVVRDWLRGRSDAALSVFGPFDAAGALGDLRAALAHGSAAVGLAMALAVWAPRAPKAAGVVALLGLTADLALANARHIRTVPQSEFETRPRVLSVIEAAERAEPSPGPFRVYRMTPWSPLAWNTRGSPRRVEESVRWERDSLRPKYGLTYGLNSTLSVGTTELLDYSLFFSPWTVPLDPAVARELGLTPGQPAVYYPRRGFDLWNTRYFVLPARLAVNSSRRGYAAFTTDADRVDPPPDAFDGPGGEDRRRRWLLEDDVQVLRNRNAFPRAWVVHQARFLTPITGMRPSDRRGVMDEILYQEDDPARTARDPRRLAWVEVDRERRHEVARSLSGAGPDPSESVTVTRDSPQRVELSAVLRTPGLAVVADVHYPGWHLTVDGRPAEILRVNRAMRGVTLGPGTHRLVFHYDPATFSVGLALSAVGLALLAALVAWCAFRRSPGEGLQPR